MDRPHGLPDLLVHSAVELRGVRHTPDGERVNGGVVKRHERSREGRADGGRSEERPRARGLGLGERRGLEDAQDLQPAAIAEMADDVGEDVDQDESRGDRMDGDVPSAMVEIEQETVTV